MRISKELCAGDTGTYTLQEAAEIFERRSRVEKKIKRQNRIRSLRWYRMAGVMVMLGVIAAMLLDEASAGIMLCLIGVAIAFGARKGNLT